MIIPTYKVFVANNIAQAIYKVPRLHRESNLSSYFYCFCCYYDIASSVVATRPGTFFFLHALSYNA